MSNILFIICSFSNVEQQIQRKYGHNVFVVSCPSAIIPYNDSLFIQVLKDEIIRNKIKTVYFVNDASSRIINAVLLRKELFGLDAEDQIQQLYDQHYKVSLIGRSISYQQVRLAELIVQHQQNEFLSNGIFTDLLIDEKIMVKTLVISRSMRMIKESRIESPVNINYEL